MSKIGVKGFGVSTEIVDVSAVQIAVQTVVRAMAQT